MGGMKQFSGSSSIAIVATAATTGRVVGRSQLPSATIDSIVGSSTPAAELGLVPLLITTFAFVADG